MTGTEIELVPKPTTELVWVETRRERRERQRRETHKLVKFIAGCMTLTFVGAFATVTLLDRPPAKAAAAETTTPAPAPPTTWPQPEVTPPTTGLGWTFARIDVPGAPDQQAKLITDGIHAERVLPGEIGAAILTSAADVPANAATVVIEGESWRIYHRGTVPANNISGLMRKPTVPVVFLISETPGDQRTYVEMRPK